MKIIINMISLFQGGPKTVGMGILEGLLLLNKSLLDKYILILPSDFGYEDSIAILGIRPDIIFIFANYPKKRFNFLYKLYYDHLYTAFIFYKYSADKLFMTANFSSLLVPSSKQVVLQHNLHYLIKGNPFQNDALTKRIKYFFEYILFYITTLKKCKYLVQLFSTKELFALKFKLSPNQIKVISMVPPLIINKKLIFHSYKKFDEQIKIIESAKNSIKFFFPASYYPNKNHGILIPLARYIKTKSLPIKIYITLDFDSKFVKDINTLGLSEIIVNLNHIDNIKINQIYKLMDCLIFPTYSESYGLPYVEAMLEGLPILTGDYDFSREVCGDAALYFTQDNVQDLCNIVETFLDPNIREDLITKSLKRATLFNHNWKLILNECLSF